MACMGIATFRSSFITWDRETGEPFHNINMWQDKRTKDLVSSWNNSVTLAALKRGSGFLHALTGSQRFKACHALKCMTQAVSFIIVAVFSITKPILIGCNLDGSSNKLQHICIG